MRIVPLPSQESLSLTNSGELELFFIGVGSALAMKHFQLNFLIIKGDAHVMVDFGMTAPIALAQTARLKLADIEVVLPTHSHADHVGGLESLVLTNRYVGQPFMKKPKTKAIINEEYQRILWDYTLRGGLEHNEGAGGGDILTFSDYFDVVRPSWSCYSPREIFKVDYNGIKIELFRTKHIPDIANSWEASFISYGLFIDERIFVSMDTRFDMDLINLYAPRAEVMFHDVQFFSGAVHAPLSDLKTLPDSIKSKMYLMHYSDDYEQHDISDFAGWTQQGVRYVF
mgnify:CR=1 FL=1